MVRIFISHLAAEVIAALLVATDQHPLVYLAGGLAAGFAAGFLVQLWLAHRNDRIRPPPGPAERQDGGAR